MSIESVVPSNHLILCHPLLLPPSIFPSIRVSSNESALRIRWPKYWSFSFNISRSKEYSGLISFRMDWLDLLAVQGTLKRLLQHHSSKASILQQLCSTGMAEMRWPTSQVRKPQYDGRCWSGCKEIPYTQGQRRSPSKMVGGENSRLESNPIPARDAQRAQTL